MESGTITHGLGRRTTTVLIALLALFMGLLTPVHAEEPGARSFSTWNAGPPDDEGALHRINDSVLRSSRYWLAGYRGDGIDIALIDTGVSPVPGLDDPDRLIYGPDISFDAWADNLRYLDLYGHGTHLGSIIAGSDDAEAAPGRSTKRSSFSGVAPEARIVSIKVADGAGRADVSQVIAAINWVIEHRNSGDLDIRVITLAYGTDGSQDYLIDPLAHAVETAWRNGIVVVVAAGNDGADSAVRNPAIDPYVISVGAVETEGTYGTGDDTVLPFSSCGNPDRHVDVLAPGKSVLGLRVANSYIDHFYPEAVVNERYFRGSGTSQAAAIVTGAVALILDQRPDMTPDQVKAMLTGTAKKVPGASETCQGAGVIDLGAAFRAPTPTAAVQTWPESTGLGSLEAARGSHHIVSEDGEVLTGEVDVMGASWDPETWAHLTTIGATWDQGVWNTNAWTGSGWSTKTWSTKTWSTKTWSTKTWSTKTWSMDSWSTKTWSTKTWSTKTWSNAVWNGEGWSTKTWSTKTWSTKTWSGTASLPMLSGQWR